MKNATKKAPAKKKAAAKHRLRRRRSSLGCAPLRARRSDRNLSTRGSGNVHLSLFLFAGGRSRRFFRSGELRCRAYPRSAVTSRFIVEKTSSRLIVRSFFFPLSAPPSEYSKCNCSGPVKFALRTRSKNCGKRTIPCGRAASSAACHFPFRVLLPYEIFDRDAAQILAGNAKALDPAAESALHGSVRDIVIHTDQLRIESIQDLAQIPDRCANQSGARMRVIHMAEALTLATVERGGGGMTTRGLNSSICLAMRTTIVPSTSESAPAVVVDTAETGHGTWSTSAAYGVSASTMSVVSIGTSSPCCRMMPTSAGRSWRTRSGSMCPFFRTARSMPSNPISLAPDARSSPSRNSRCLEKMATLSGMP